MTRLDSKHGAMTLRPRAQILRRIGDELVSSETVAVIELVKNAYDADATRVLVRFQEPLEIGQGMIEVIDNGHGMSLETIQNAWMEPATLMKKRQIRSEQRGRRVLGEKGIGRFAASRLADGLEVVTRRIGTDSEVQVVFDWSQFDDEQKYLDQIEVLWKAGKPAEICPGGTIEVLWQGGKKPEASELTHGTILRMKGLRVAWDRGQFEKLRTDLSRLISPFFVQDHISSTDEFQIRLQLPAPGEDLSGIVEPPESLKNPHHLIKGYVDKTGSYNLKIKLRGQEKEKRIVGKFSLGHPPQCGPFRLELRVWEREASDLAKLVELYGSTLKNIRGDLDKAAGINIYRDGFRVLPYGEPRNDWLQLDSRRVQNPTMRLSNNQIVGYVLVSADDNPLLRDQSNREGLIEGPALDDLRQLVKMVLTQLETERYSIRHPQEVRRPTRRGGLFTDFDLVILREQVKLRHPEDSELLALVGEKEKDLEKRVEEVQEVIARYWRLATLGQLIDTVLHDGRTPLAKIGREAHLGLRDGERTSKDQNGLLQKLSDRFRAIVTQSEVLATVFRKIEPFGGRKRGRPSQVCLEQVIASAFSVLDKEIAEVGAQVKLPKTDTQILVDQAEIQEVLINLLQNSLYWLRQVPKDCRQIVVRTRRKGPDQVEILFSDSGPGVKPEFREHIFDPYFSAKPDGVGLGLTIAGEIINEYYAGSLNWSRAVHSRALPSASCCISGCDMADGTIWQLLFVDDEADTCQDATGREVSAGW
jgi:signal transduction histidine kinase